MRASLFFIIAICAAGCSDNAAKSVPQQVGATQFETIGSITVTKSGLIDPSAKIEKLGGDYGWSEGPVWVCEIDNA